MSRRNIVVVLVLGAVGAAAMAGRGLISSGQRAADTAPAKLEVRASETRAQLEASLARLTKPLEDQVARAAAVPELKSALSDRVDAPTLLDLFETEDWWAPFRARDTAILIGSQVVVARGEKQLPAPAGLAPSPATPGVRAGLLLGGGRPLLAAAAGIARPDHPEAATLLMTAPFDAQQVAADAHVPVALSDGQRLLVFAGSEPPGTGPRSILGGLVGKERSAVVADASGLVAVALPAGPGLWLWGLAALPRPPAEASGDPRLWSALVGLLVLLALLVWTTRPRQPVAARATPTPGGVLPTVEAVAHPDPRMPSTMILGPTPTGPNADPSMFGRYRLLRRLDGGGMADIYTAVLDGAEGFQRTLVIKRLRPELTRSRNAVDQFIDEAKLGAMLTHPNIVPVFDFGKVGDEYFMAEEFVLGRDITRLLQRHQEVEGRPLSERFMMYVAHEVAEALAYAHAQVGADGRPLGIVHRDVSPGNIMITGRGDVKLFDFGIVQATGRVSRTEVGVVKGNVSFMSPEQARGEKVDARADLFSLGLVIFYGLTNEQIYRGSGTFEQLLQAASGPKPEDLGKVAGHPLASGIVARALAVDPAQRYQSAAELAAALAPHVIGARAEVAALIQRLFGDELRAAAAG